MEISERLISRMRRKQENPMMQAERLSASFYQQFYKALDRANGNGVKIMDFTRALVAEGLIPESKEQAAYQHFSRRYQKAREQHLSLAPNDR